MQVYHFAKGQAPVALVEPQAVGGSGFFWLDVERSEQDWHEQAQAWLGTRLHERHVLDTLNETHPPYYDGTEDYDLLVVRTLCPDCPPEAPTTRPVALIISARAVVSVRPPGDPVFTRLRERLLDGQRKSPNAVPMLLYLLIDQVLDSLLARRDVTSELLTRWQERLLDRSDQFNDWQSLMRLRAQLRRLEIVTESQVDALDEWREQTARQLDGSLAVRFNDLREHQLRIYNHASVTQHDIDALVQIYFSANTQRTNDTLQFLAVVSAIFLPLNLLAGLFGMNFTHMPLLGLWYGPWLLGATMLLLVAGLLLWFRRRTWV